VTDRQTSCDGIVRAMHRRRAVKTKQKTVALDSAKLSIVVLQEFNFNISPTTATDELLLGCQSQSA